MTLQFLYFLPKGALISKKGAFLQDFEGPTGHEPVDWRASLPLISTECFVYQSAPINNRSKKMCAVSLIIVAVPQNFIPTAL